MPHSSVPERLPSSADAFTVPPVDEPASADQRFGAAPLVATAVHSYPPDLRTVVKIPGWPVVVRVAYRHPPSADISTADQLVAALIAVVVALDSLTNVHSGAVEQVPV